MPPLPSTRLPHLDRVNLVATRIQDKLKHPPARYGVVVVFRIRRSQSHYQGCKELWPSSGHRCRSLPRVSCQDPASTAEPSRPRLLIASAIDSHPRRKLFPGRSSPSARLLPNGTSSFRPPAASTHVFGSKKGRRILRAGAGKGESVERGIN